MKVFFTSSQRGKKYFSTYYSRIYREIKNLGHKHLEKSFLKVSPREFYNELEQHGRKTYVKFYENNIKIIKEADVSVYECSIHSLSIGFMIEKSLEFNKPTIALYLEDNTPHFLMGIKDEKLILKNYNNKNLTEVLKKAFEEAKQKTDKRFNFFITPKLLAYLNKVSREQRITKSTFIRNLIQEHMKRTNHI